MKIFPKKQKGFTLLEILLVIAAIAILAGIIIIAINPSKQLCDTKNAKRNLEKNSIVDAINQYQIDHSKLPGPDPIPTGTESDAKPICQTNQTDFSCINLSDLTNGSLYLSSIPVDPSITNNLYSGYFIYQNQNTGRVEIIATHTCASENNGQQLFYSLSYFAGFGGSITGDLNQTVGSGSMGSSVTAVPDNDHHFVSWTDGSTQNPRTDLGINNFNVGAQFSCNQGSVCLLQ